MKRPEDTATIGDVMDIINPLFLALHHEGVISAQAIAMQYEDLLVRRQIVNREPSASLDVLQQVLRGLHQIEQKTPPG